MNWFFWLEKEHSNLFYTILGALLGWIVPIFFYIKLKIKNFIKYRKYNGKYNVYLKDVPGGFIQFTLTVKASDNILVITGNAYKDNKEMEEVSGRIEMMDKSLRNYGRGYYTHKLPPSPTRRFGFYEIQLDGPRILSHQIIKGVDQNEIGADKSAGYVWHKV